MIDTSDITGLILAGGRGSRMGGIDKGMQNFNGVPLALHTLLRLGPQVGHMMVNANRNLAAYEAFGAPVWPDVLADYAGPLAGFLTGLERCETPYLVTVPCDTPLFPHDLVARLAHAMQDQQAQIAMAAAREEDPGSESGAGSQLRPQPVFCLMQVDLMESLVRFTHGGGRKIDAWTAQHKTALVAFDQPGDEARAFFNANTLAELHRLESVKSIAEVAAQLQGYDPQALSAGAVNEFLAQLVEPVAQVEHVPILQALGRVLAQEVISPISVPPHDNSAMDGYAFDGALLSGGAALELQVAGTALAGKAWQGTVGPGQCVKIMTGAIMPAGLDTVVPQEFTTPAGDGRIGIPAGLLQPGDNRRLKGEDLAQGSAALQKGERLTPAGCGLAASLGLQTVPVTRRLRVACFSTGDEILSLGEAPREGAVYDSNRYTVHGLLTRLGCEVIDMGVVRDEPALLEAAFREAAAKADAIITSGGVSVGEADYTKAMMKKLGDVAFWRIAMRPGRPMAVGRIPSTGSGQAAVLFGLPGNPVAVMVTFLAFVRPALLRMMGSTEAPPPLLRARSQDAIRKKAGRTEYQRGIVSTGSDGRVQVRITGNQGSGVLSSMVQANGLIVLDHAQGNVAQGDEVGVMMFEGVL